MGDAKLLIPKNKPASTATMVFPGTPLETSRKWQAMMRKYVDANKDICKMAVVSEESRAPCASKQFVTSSRYEGGWNILGMHGLGTYTFRSKDVIYEGSFDDGQFHGNGELRYDNGAIVTGTWDHGELRNRMLVFADGLEYSEKSWKYCKMPDRRFTVEYEKNLNPAGETYKTAEQPSVEIPPGFYDVGDGFFDPKTKVVYKYDDLNGIIRAPGLDECKWNLENCRKCPDDQLGPYPSVYEDWEKPVLELEIPPPPAGRMRFMDAWEKEPSANESSNSRLKLSHAGFKI